MAGHVGTIARRRDALAAAALADLGERGTIDVGTHTLARGGTRQRRTSSPHVGIGYARHATHANDDGTTGAYHYAYSWARQPTDSHRSEGRRRIAPRRHAMSVALPQSLRDPDAPVIGVNADGSPRYRAARGAVVTGSISASMMVALPRHKDARREVSRYRAAALQAHGIGL